MKNFLNSLRKIIKPSISQDSAKVSELNSGFFKPYSAKDLPPKTDAKVDYVVEEGVPEMNRVILSGLKRTLVQSKINSLVMNARFSSLSPTVEETVEKLHYACYNNTPISVHYVKKLVPEISFEDHELLNEEDYDAWLKSKKRGNESYSYRSGDSKYTIEDPVGVKGEFEKGKTEYTEWKTNQKSGWKRK